MPRSVTIPISIHAPPRGATGDDGDAQPACSNFNSRPSARGDYLPLLQRFPAVIFQFTPLREGRPPARLCGHTVSTISIHAPPRGATKSRSRQFRRLHISIHAPPRGATLKSRESIEKRNFNSRPSARGDTVIAYIIGEGMTISIHAPPRGATRTGHLVTPLNKFQFTPLREGRLPEVYGEKADVPFQFTPLREGRLPSMNAIWRGFLFQFTPLREGRRLCDGFYAQAQLFQFTPLREGRQSCLPR